MSCEGQISTKSAEIHAGIYGIYSPRELVDRLVRRGECSYSEGERLYQQYFNPIAAPIITFDNALAIIQATTTPESTYQTELAQEAIQLQLKSEMLTSDTAQWASQLIYDAALAETNTEIATYNKMITQDAAVSETAHDIPWAETASKTVSDVVETAKKSAVIPLVLAAGVLVLILMVLFRRH